MSKNTHVEVRGRYNINGPKGALCVIVYIIIVCAMSEISESSAKNVV